MSITNDVARLKRLADPKAKQWEKTRDAIVSVISNVVIPQFPNIDTHVKDRTPHYLPRGYVLWHTCHKFSLIKILSSKTHCYITSATMGVRDMMTIAHDIRTGWLEEVKEVSLRQD